MTRTSANSGDEQSLTGIAWLRDMLRRLYHGRTPAAFRFQMAVIVIDLAIIAFFIATPVLSETRTFLWIDYSVAAIVAARHRSRGCLPRRTCCRLLRQPTSWVDSSSWRRCFSRRRSPISASCASSGSGRWRTAARLWRPLERARPAHMARADRRGRQPGHLPLHRHRLRLHLLLHATAQASKAMSTRSISPSRRSPRPASATSCCLASPAS